MGKGREGGRKTQEEEGPQEGYAEQEGSSTVAETLTVGTVMPAVYHSILSPVDAAAWGPLCAPAGQPPPEQPTVSLD